MKIVTFVQTTNKRCNNQSDFRIETSNHLTFLAEQIAIRSAPVEAPQNDDEQQKNHPTHEHKNI